MPTQTPVSKVEFYRIGDTAPDLERQLVDGNGVPYNLNGAHVFLTLAPMVWQYYNSFAYPSRDTLLHRSPCNLLDQTAFAGWVSWTPGTDELRQAGTYGLYFEIEWPDGRWQSISPKNFKPLVVNPKPGYTPAPPAFAAISPAHDTLHDGMRNDIDADHAWIRLVEDRLNALRVQAGVIGVVPTRSALPTGPSLTEAFYVRDEHRALIVTDDGKMTGTSGVVVWKPIGRPTFAFYDSSGDPTTAYPAVSADLLIDTFADRLVAYSDGGAWFDIVPPAASTIVPIDDTLNPNTNPTKYGTGRANGDKGITKEAVWEWTDDQTRIPTISSVAAAFRAGQAPPGVDAGDVAAGAPAPTQRQDGTPLQPDDYYVNGVRIWEWQPVGAVPAHWLDTGFDIVPPVATTAPAWVKLFDFDSGIAVVPMRDGDRDPNADKPMYGQNRKPGDIAISQRAVYEWVTDELRAMTLLRGQLPPPLPAWIAVTALDWVATSVTEPPRVPPTALWLSGHLTITPTGVYIWETSPQQLAGDLVPNAVSTEPSVANQAALPTPAPTAGKVRVTLDTMHAWIATPGGWNDTGIVIPAGGGWIKDITFAGSAAASLIWDGTGAKPASTAAGQFLVDSRINRIIGVATAAATPWVTVLSQHTYVGSGAWDNTHVDSAHNWGMPRGTKPDPVTNPPAVDDIYWDLHRGTLVVFG